MPSPRGAFLAKLPPKGNFGGLVDKAKLWTNEGRSTFLVSEIFQKKFLKIKGHSTFLVF